MLGCSFSITANNVCCQLVWRYFTASHVSWGMMGGKTHIKLQARLFHVSFPAQPRCRTRRHWCTSAAEGLIVISVIESCLLWSGICHKSQHKRRKTQPWTLFFHWLSSLTVLKRNQLQKEPSASWTKIFASITLCFFKETRQQSNTRMSNVSLGNLLQNHHNTKQEGQVASWDM